VLREAWCYPYIHRDMFDFAQRGYASTTMLRQQVTHRQLRTAQWRRFQHCCDGPYTTLEAAVTGCVECLTELLKVSTEGDWFDAKIKHRVNRVDPLRERLLRIFSFGSAKVEPPTGLDRGELKLAVSGESQAVGRSGHAPLLCPIVTRTA